jgi:molecular chaperone GrpE (heat shock protein)
MARRNKKSQPKNDGQNKWKNLYKKALSDIVHLEEKLKQDITFAIETTKREIFFPLLEILDDLERVIFLSKDEQKKPIKMIREKLLNILARYGVREIERKEGDQFDPLKDEVIGIINGKANNVIRQIVRKGYMMKDTLLRPTRVIVEKEEKEK